MNDFDLSAYRTSTMRSDISSIYHPSPTPSLAGNVSSGNTPGYRQSPPVPIDKTTCIALVANALRKARENNREAELRGRGNNSPDLGAQQQLYQRSGVTIDLSHQKISNIPLDVIELIKDEIERLALAHNQLISFSEEFSSLPRLRYLNLRSNFLREFPLPLTKLPSLEILDVSRNRLRSLPQDFGKLMSLKVLSMSKNKINVLPTYIGDMNELKILKLDHNPILFPPKDVLENGEADRDTWLEAVKRFLKNHAERSNPALDTGSGSSSDEGGGDNDFSSLNTTVARTPSFESERPESSLSTIKPLKLAGEATMPALNGPQKGSLPRRPPQKQPTLSPSPALPTSALTSPPQSQINSGANSSQTERSRSNSESTVQAHRGNRRMGMLGPRKTSTVTAPEGLRTVEEQKTLKHQRGYSHDSVIDSAQRSAQMGKPVDGSSRSPTDKERQPGPYFRRLSSLPEHKRASLSSARVGEAARGILYAMSTLQRPIEQYVQSAGDPNGGPHHKVERVLYNGNLHIGSLVGSLEAYEEKDDEAAVDKVVDACCACLAAFKQVLNMVQSDSREIGAGMVGADARYMRTLLLMVYGSYVEIQSSYDIIKPLIMGQASDSTLRSYNPGNLIARYPPNSNGNLRLKSASTASSTTSIATSVVSISQSAAVPPALPTPRGDTFAVPPTPGFQSNLSHSSDGGFDHDEPLYGKFQAATAAALSTLPIIDREIKTAVTQNLQPSTTLKLREVSSLCATGAEAARRLSKTKWDAIRDGDIIERRKFWEDTNKFTNVGSLLLKSLKLKH
ncbi:RAM signaling pathway protein-domain-containing protein [Tuber brumale]|nr:RAM signaling pathway protein-domain-containing protein [Tuber brumale]